MTSLRVTFLFFSLLAASTNCPANTIDLGVLSFDTLIPAGTAPGVNVFTIDNFTGDPASGGFALPPDFPVLTDARFLTASLTIFSGASSLLVDLGDLLPGSYTPTTLQFTDTLSFTAAVFAATLDPGALMLAGGTTFFPASLHLTVSLTPITGSALQPGVDFATLAVSDAVPEPSTWVFLLTGLLLYLPCKKCLGNMPRLR